MVAPTTSSSADSFGGHYTTAGAAVCAVGVAGLLVDAYATLTQAPTGFIDREAMAVMSVAFLLVGGWMMLFGRRHGKASD
ncbi:MAG: hypothetical protein AAGA54_00925 [Myxococcota bacterium]